MLTLELRSIRVVDWVRTNIRKHYKFKILWFHGCKSDDNGCDGGSGIYVAKLQNDGGLPRRLEGRVCTQTPGKRHTRLHNQGFTRFFSNV